MSAMCPGRRLLLLGNFDGRADGGRGRPLLETLIDMAGLGRGLARRLRQDRQAGQQQERARGDTRFQRERHQ